MTHFFFFWLQFSCLMTKWEVHHPSKSAIVQVRYSFETQKRTYMSALVSKYFISNFIIRWSSFFGENQDWKPFISLMIAATDALNCSLAKNKRDKSGDLRVTHQAPANRWSSLSCMVSVVARICFCDGRTDERTYFVKIMTTYSVVARWVKNQNLHLLF